MSVKWRRKSSEGFINKEIRQRADDQNIFWRFRVQNTILCRIREKHKPRDQIFSSAHNPALMAFSLFSSFLCRLTKMGNFSFQNSMKNR
jgi:hypothetical protein